MWIYVPSFCYGEKRGFLYYVRLREKPFSACTEQFVWTYMRYIYSFRQKIYKEEMTHG